MKPRRRRRRLDCPQAVADRCLERAWDDSCPDRERRLLEAASKTIDRLMYRLATQAQVLEVVEAELAKGRYPLIDDDNPEMGL